MIACGRLDRKRMNVPYWDVSRAVILQLSPFPAGRTGTIVLVSLDSRSDVVHDCVAHAGSTSLAAFRWGRGLVWQTLQCLRGTQQFTMFQFDKRARHSGKLSYVPTIVWREILFARR